MSASGVLETHPGELDMLRGLVRTLRVVVCPSDASVGEVRRLLHQHAADEAAARATARRTGTASGLTERQAQLLDAIRAYGGAWTTGRVLALYALTDPSVVQRGTARRDLTALHRAGHLVLVDDPGNRHYTLTRKDVRP